MASIEKQTKLLTVLKAAVINYKQGLTFKQNLRVSYLNKGISSFCLTKYKVSIQ